MKLQGIVWTDEAAVDYLSTAVWRLSRKNIVRVLCLFSFFVCVVHWCLDAMSSKNMYGVCIMLHVMLTCSMCSMNGCKYFARVCKLMDPGHKCVAASLPGSFASG